MNLNMRCLLIEDDPDFAELLLLRLRTRDISVVPTLSAALQMIAKKAPEIILLDIYLFDSKGGDTLNAIHRLKQVAPGALVVVLTGDDRERTRDKALLEGADRFIGKDERGLFKTLSDICCRIALNEPCASADTVEQIEQRVVKLAGSSFCGPSVMAGFAPVAALLRS